jgi:biotin carboxylase
MRILALGAGPAQLGLLEAARAHGVWTAVCDRDPAAPGFRLAGRRCIVSIEDEPAVERLAGALDLNGVIAPASDRGLAVAARVAARLGLPHPVPPATAALATSRLRRRERLAEAGVPQPRWEVVTGDTTELEPPVVVRPPDGPGRHGLTAVHDGRELAVAIGAARRASRSGAVLVEELVSGPEVTISGYALDGELATLAVADVLFDDRGSLEPPLAFGVATAHVWPSPHAERAAEVGRRAVEALGIAHGPTHVRLRLSRGGPEVIDAAPRLGDGHDAELVEAVTGVELDRLALAAALGERVSRADVTGRFREQVGGAVTRFLHAPPGVLEAVEAPQGLPGVASVRVYHEPGFVFGRVARASDRAGALLAVGATREEALARAESAAERIRFVTADAALV